jgi:hypothetical protein
MEVVMINKPLEVNDVCTWLESKDLKSQLDSIKGDDKNEKVNILAIDLKDKMSGIATDPQKLKEVSVLVGQHLRDNPSGPAYHALTQISEFLDSSESENAIACQKLFKPLADQSKFPQFNAAHSDVKMEIMKHLRLPELGNLAVSKEMNIEVDKMIIKKMNQTEDIPLLTVDQALNSIGKNKENAALVKHLQIINCDGDQLKLLCEKFPNIEKLILINSPKISDDVLVNLQPLKNLKYLDLSNSSITGEGFVHLEKNEHLEKLDLAMCRKLTDEGLKKLGSLKSLKDINLTFCAGLNGTGLSSLKTIQFLNLEKCMGIRDLQKDHFKEMQELQTLNLSGCSKIEDKDLESIAELKNLRDLKLSGITSITEAGVSRLTPQLPNLKILKISSKLKIQPETLKSFRDSGLDLETTV